MSPDEIKAVLSDHAAWLRGEGGKRANLSRANLCGANLSLANLSRANLCDANLSDANLCDANLSDANLCLANLRGANLSLANLRGANLSGANLSRANLCGANLSGANLSDANLCDCAGNGREVRTVQSDIWTIIYTAEVMQIGCQRHAISDWWAFSDEAIDDMDIAALEWWGRWKPVLQKIIEISPATPTGAVAETVAA